MLFNSFEFVVFLAIVLPVYYVLPQRWQNRLVVVASYVFYGWWDWRFLILLATSTVLDYHFARLIHASSSQVFRKKLIYLSVGTNLGILGFFKYYGFFADTAARALGQVGLHPSFVTLHIILPVGVSFYTFQSMAYVIDIYRGQARPARDLETFALYVCYFPQLVAGPIERCWHLLPQIEGERRIEAGQVAIALQRILMGYFKKVFIADAVAPYVDRAFANPEQLSSPELLLSLYLFAVQIYGDFAGYTDIARGVSLLLGIDLTVNFRQPYLSTSITEFWRRWHISLSSWLRDYLYIPLGGNRHGRLMTYRNLMVTMLLGGLWHGASWNFVTWGGLHGLYLSVHRAIGRAEPVRRERSQFAAALTAPLARRVLTFHLVCVAWVFFRAKDFSLAWRYLAALWGNWHTCSPMLAAIAAAYVLATLLVDLLCERHEGEVPVPHGWPAFRKGLVYAIAIALLSFIGESSARPFIYFQF